VIYHFGIHVSLHAPKLGALKFKNLKNSNFAELFGPNCRCGTIIKREEPIILETIELNLFHDFRYIAEKNLIGAPTRMSEENFLLH